MHTFKNILDMRLKIGQNVNIDLFSIILSSGNEFEDTLYISRVMCFESMMNFAFVKKPKGTKCIEESEISRCSIISLISAFSFVSCFQSVLYNMCFVS